MANLRSSDPLLLEMLTTLRESLHYCPEGSGVEAFTSGLVSDFLSRYKPDTLVTHLGGYGVAAVFEGEHPGPTVMVRSELDAVPIEADHDGPTHSLTASFAHRCGHDAHMTMVAGIAPLLAHERPKRGRVVLLFQPAEETGAGAAQVLQDPHFGHLRPDCAIALHNLPGYPARTVVVNDGGFTSASVGMRAELFGTASHAAEPEKGRPPAGALSRLLVELPELNRMNERPYRMVSITHARMGRYSFGVSPGHVELCATLRATTTKALVDLQAAAARAVHEHAQRDGLVAEVEWLEAFPEIKNDPRMAQLAEEVARENGCEVQHTEVPFRWSDDFGHFAQTSPSVYFGLGIGEEAAGLHQPEYCFPGELVGLGLKLLYETAMKALEQDTFVHVPELGGDAADGSEADAGGA